jgi:hypothetical protein
MNLIQKLELIERVDALIRRKATGCPTELSNKLTISKRNVFNIINTMKDLGAPIRFCKHMNSYYYEEKVTFSFGFNVREESIYGGLRTLKPYFF